MTNLSSFQKNILTMLSGSSGGQIIGLLGSFVIAKLFGPEAYGLFGVYIGCYSVLSIINTLQLEYGIVISKDNIGAIKTTNTTISTIIGLSFLLIPFLFLVYNFTNLNKYPLEIFLISLTASISFSISKVLQSYYTYNRNFKKLSFIKFILPLLNLSFQTAFYFIDKEKGLIYGNLIALIIVGILYFRPYKHFKFISRLNYKKNIQEHFNIIKYLYPSYIINVFATVFFPLLIAFYFSMEQYGVYFFALKILGIPFHVISTSILPVYFKKASTLFNKNNKELYNLTYKTIISCFFIILLFLIFINLLGTKILVFFFDKDWDNLALYIQIASFLILAKVIYNPISDILVVIHKNHITLYLNIYLLNVSILAIFIGVNYNNIIYTISILSFIGGVGYLAITGYILAYLKTLTKH